MVDMIFGGKLTSVLVCQKCKHVSQTFEDFNDISLSIKAEDYKEKKRTKLKNLAKKITSLKPSSSPVASTHAHRPSSVPPLDHTLSPSLVDPRRRSEDVLSPFHNQNANDAEADVPAESVPPSGTVSPDPRHVEFLDPQKELRKSDGWSKLGRRLSIGMSKKDRSRSRDRSSREFTRESSLQSVDETRSAPNGQTSRNVSVSSQATTHSTNSSLHNITIEQPTPSLPAPLMSPTSAHLTGEQNKATLPLFSGINRSRSPRRPKPSRGETEYLRRIMADVTVPSQHSLGFLRSPEHSHSDIGQPSTWLKQPAGKLQSVEACLRMFASVEILEGDNMVGCRRCWKIANGVYKPRVREEDGYQVEEAVEDDDDSEPNDRDRTFRGFSLAAPIPSHGFAVSTPDVSRDGNSTDDESLATTLPTSVSDTALNQAGKGLDDDEDALTPLPSRINGISIPRISTTGPDILNEGEEPITARPHPHTAVGQAVLTALSLPTPAPSNHASRELLPVSQTSSRRSSVTSDFDSDDSSDEETDSDAMQSDCEPSRRPMSMPVFQRNGPGTGIAQQPLPTPPSMKAGDSADKHTAIPQRKKKTRPKPVIMRPAYKRYLIGVPPPVLVIHLKRFQQISAKMLSFSNGFKKLDDFVSYPEYLDLTPFLAPKKEEFKKSGKWGMSHKKKGKEEEEKCMYRLYAVVVHIGNMVCTTSSCLAVPFF